MKCGNKEKTTVENAVGGIMEGKDRSKNGEDRDEKKDRLLENWLSASNNKKQKKSLYQKKY